jgi:acyl-CoA reductase-like NAD-dependent aldehyde dehydrogenase
MTDPTDLLRLVETAHVPSGDLLIGDRWESDASGGRRVHLNPSNGEPLASIAMAGPAEIDRAIDAARTAFPSWRAMSPARRRDLLLELACLIDEHDIDLGVLRSLETGAPFKRKRGASLAGEWIRYYAGWADKIEGATIPTSAGPALDYTLLEPYGVVAVLTPWNGGLVSAAMKVAPALAAANCVVLKPAEVAPLAPLRFAELCLEAGLPPGVVNVVPGGADAGAALVGDARIGKISFTGGAATARRIFATASQHLTPVVMELGGKSANVVFADADLDAAAMIAVHAGIGPISGQGCVLPTRLLVEGSVYDDVQARVVALAEALVVGPPFEDGVQMGPVIDDRSCERILGVIEEARSDRAGRLLTGGHRLGGRLATGYFIAPTVFGDVEHGSDLAQHEVFGPVLAVQRFHDEDEAVQLANGTEYGLGGIVFTNDLRRGHRVAAQIEAGYVGINGFPPMPAGAPFGGMKQSGFGREGGRAGLEEFLRPKNVYVQL